MNWKVSGHSGQGNCLEADGPWKVSTYSSSGAGPDCLEAGARGGTAGCVMVQVRDTKEKWLVGRGVVTVGGVAWTAFVKGVAG